MSETITVQFDSIMSVVIDKAIAAKIREVENEMARTNSVLTDSIYKFALAELDSIRKQIKEQKK